MEGKKKRKTLKWISVSQKRAETETVWAKDNFFSKIFLCNKQNEPEWEVSQRKHFKGLLS